MPEIKYITVSPNFKIAEAIRGLRKCEAEAERAELASAEQNDWKRYAEQWRTIAISWASR